MCGRFVSSTPPDQLAVYFDVDAVPEQLLERGANYNTAPTSGVLVVLEDGSTRRLDQFRWGLVPSWAKDRSIGARMINARAETVASKPAFRRAFAKRRCIIPADGFYEWTTRPGQERRQPWYIQRPDSEPFAFAGIWEQWSGPKSPPDDAAAPDGAAAGVGAAAGEGAPATPAEPLRSCSIITTSANEKMSELHDRMPVVLARSDWDAWLAEDQHDTELLGTLLVPAPSELISFHPVSTEVNNARNKGEHLLEPIELDA